MPSGPEIVNAHHSSWGAEQDDLDGEDLFAWCFANEMAVVNSGDKTRYNADSGNFSAPDVTIAHNSQEDRITWRTTDLLGSDHKAIVCELSKENAPVPGEALSKTRWNWDKADWTGYVLQLDRMLSSRPHGVNRSIDRFYSWFIQCVLTAAKQSVGQRRSSKFGKPSITDNHLRQLCNTRNRIGRHLPDRKDQWTEACRAVREYRKQLQDRQWQKFLDEVDVHHSPGKAWSVVNSLNGKFVPAPKNEVLIHNGRIYDTPAKKERSPPENLPKSAD